MRQRVTIVDLVTRGPVGKYFSRMMNANYASIMPQAVAAWCAELGHEVRYVCYTGVEDLAREAAARPDVVVLGSFTRSALAAYAVSNLFRRFGAVTVLGGPHARCYPEDAAKYFDYVLGFTDKPLIADLLKDCAPQRPLGRRLSAARQPVDLPGVEQRWPYIASTLAKARGIRMVPMIGSMGCPYRCAFCIDSVVDYRPMGFDLIKSDLRFLAGRLDRPVVGWHDPNFGVRFDDYMGAIEEAVPSGSVRFVAESTLSLLSESNVERLARNGFVGMLPGIESWYEFGEKSRATRSRGAERVRRVAEHVNMILSRIPFVQTNFVLGLDSDEGPEPFELTKRFMKLTPGAYPAFSLLTCYGRAAPMNLDLQRSGRVLPVPFQFLDSNRLSNVRPAHYDVTEFAERVADLLGYALSSRVIARRLLANRSWTVRWLNALRAGTSKRYRWQRAVADRLAVDPAFRAYFEGRTRVLPPLLRDRVERGLGGLWPLLPEGALEHDENAYLDDAGGAVPADGNALSFTIAAAE
jgi:hypothetical protein